MTDSPAEYVPQPPAAPTGSSAAARPTSAAVARIKSLYDRISDEIAKIYVGQDELVLGTLVALFSSGHVLIESVPGLGKTLFVRAMGRVLGCQCGRIQFTADLMPSDITGAPIFDMKQQEFRFRPGPVFTQFLLADEINRSPAKTHAALLEIMQEYRVTIERTSHKLKRPFLVLATQNPLESEGTYNLPEAQLDRFMFKIVADYPSAEEEIEILKQHGKQADLDSRLATTLTTVTTPEEIVEITALCSGVHVEDRLFAYINALVRQTRQWPQFHIGGSPRAGIALVQGARTLAAFRGRDFAVPDDVVDIALPALRHRVVLTAEAEVEGQTTDDQLREMIRTIEVPRL
ncbi:MAG: MoxR family ATPase [Planctomycetota bacterium]|nr:MAG: MoxR family ATPase [Planctomycetota bacterium]